eukprot:gnl/TRDRNA2_/TRDRNA2_165353_c1_seq1.p2 gnl/TRDRNA2_/TRDRNA2_165353_c1~~gnl/TRDRNA2_/TRDRNA2_165353_c1_seq1.p2  ORF type:complete len:116 (+),score=4.23 gnl/TRDRNA2_/TRDRNA2_165353_c1_seq1:53-400(+)
MRKYQIMLEILLGLTASCAQDPAALRRTSGGIDNLCENVTCTPSAEGICAEDACCSNACGVDFGCHWGPCTGEGEPPPAVSRCIDNTHVDACGGLRTCPAFVLLTTMVCGLILTT